MAGGFDGWRSRFVLVALAALGSTACRSEADPPAAELIDEPVNEADRLGSSALMTSSDLPAGFELAEAFDPFPDPDVPQCDGLATLDAEFGDRASGWIIDYQGPDAEGTVVHVTQIVNVWNDPIAEERTTAGADVADDCWVARIRRNFENNALDAPFELGHTTRAKVHVITDTGAAGTGVRIETSVTEAGIPFGVFYDVLYVPDRRVTNVLIMSTAAVTVSDDLREAIVSSAAARAERVQQ